MVKNLFWEQIQNYMKTRKELKVDLYIKYVSKHHSIEYGRIQNTRSEEGTSTGAKYQLYETRP